LVFCSLRAGGGASLERQAGKIASPRIIYTIKVNSILSGIFNLYKYSLVLFYKFAIL